MINMKILNYHKSTTGNPVQILIGSTNSTVIKSLEIINGDSDAVVKIYRKDDSKTPVKYGEITVNLESYNYLMLWEGFIAIPEGHTLWIESSIVGIEAVANVVEI